MKTSEIIFGICIATALVVSGCKKESTELLSDEVPIELKKSDDASFDCAKAQICKSGGGMISVSINACYTQMSKGGMLFSCSAAAGGITLAQIQSQLNTRVLANGGNLASKTDQSIAFEEWFYDTYCAPDEEIEGGGVFEEDPGTDL